MQTEGDDALLICRAAGPHETYWIGPDGLPVDTKTSKYQVFLILCRNNQMANIARINFIELVNEYISNSLHYSTDD